MSDLILYTTEDGRSRIKLRAQEPTVWLTQLEKLLWTKKRRRRGLNRCFASIKTCSHTS